MRYGAAVAKRTHASHQRPPLGTLQSAQLSREMQLRARHALSHLAIQLAQLRVGRRLAVLQTQDRRQQTSHARRPLQVAHISLDARHVQRATLRPPAPVHSRQSLSLDGVSELSARAVRLHQTHVARRQARVRKRRLQQSLLRLSVGRRQRRARAVLHHRRAAHHRVDRVSVPLRVFQPLQHQCAGALSTAVPVGRLVERMALAILGRHSSQSNHARCSLRQNIGARHHGRVTLAMLQASSSGVESHES